MPFWFQLYVMRDRAFIRNLVERASGELFGLMITLDPQIMGQRHKDVQRLVGPAETDPRQYKSGYQAGLVPWHAGDQAP